MYHFQSICFRVQLEDGPEFMLVVLVVLQALLRPSSEPYANQLGPWHRRWRYGFQLNTTDDNDDATDDNDDATDDNDDATDAGKQR